MTDIVDLLDGPYPNDLFDAVEQRRKALNEIKRLREALRAILSDADHYDAAVAEYCGDRLGWDSIKKAKEALGDG